MRSSKNTLILEDEFNGPAPRAVQPPPPLYICLDEEMSDVFRRNAQTILDCVQDIMKPVSDVPPKQHESRFVACHRVGRRRRPEL